MALPNLLLIHTHDTGRYLGCYGAPVPTPNLLRLAQEGVLFRRAFCASPGCSASRASLMTGQMPHNNGMMGLCHRGFRLNDVREHLSYRLRDADYWTQLFGFQHEVPQDSPELLGYSGLVSDRELPHRSQTRAERAAEWLADSPPQPFFLNVGFLETHREFLPAEMPDDARYVAPLPWLPDDPQVRRDLAELHTAVRHVDESVGILLSALDRSGLAENTLVLFTTDHGVPFPRAKATLFDAGIGVALLMRGPGGFSGGRVVDALVSQIDLIPTFAALGLLPLPPNAQGVSLLPLARGEAERARSEIYAEITYHAAYDPARCLRTPRHKFIRYFEDYPRMVLPNVDNSLSKYLLTDAGLPLLPRPRTMLFDLLADPQELENVAEQPEYASVREELEARLLRWMEETNDPLLSGPVPLPAGGRTTPPTDYNPNGGPRQRTDRQP